MAIYAWKIGTNKFFTFKYIPLEGTRWLLRLIVLWPHMSHMHDEICDTYSKANALAREITQSLVYCGRHFVAYSTAVTIANQVERTHRDPVNRQIMTKAAHGIPAPW